MTGPTTAPGVLFPLPKLYFHHCTPLTLFFPSSFPALPPTPWCLVPPSTWRRALPTSYLSIFHFALSVSVSLAWARAAAGAPSPPVPARSTGSPASLGPKMCWKAGWNRESRCPGHVPSSLPPGLPAALRPSQLPGVRAGVLHTQAGTFREHAPGDVHFM